MEIEHLGKKGWFFQHSPWNHFFSCRMSRCSKNRQLYLQSFWRGEETSESSNQALFYLAKIFIAFLNIKPGPDKRRCSGGMTALQSDAFTVPRNLWTPLSLLAAICCALRGGLNQTTALICNILVGFYEMKTYLLMKLRSVPYMNNDNVLHNLSLLFSLSCGTNSQMDTCKAYKNLAVVWYKNL